MQNQLRARRMTVRSLPHTPVLLEVDCSTLLSYHPALPDDGSPTTDHDDGEYEVPDSQPPTLSLGEKSIFEPIE